MGSRIEILDSFRALAVIGVLFCHYYSRWYEIYPYGSQYDYFERGALGVNFFFIISGFVILLTLEKTNRFFQFWMKRAIRLLPSIIIASTLTFLVFSVFDHELIMPKSHDGLNFIPSLSFISPAILNKLNFLGYSDYNYIDGAYWTLWTEIQFYLFISVIYYLANKWFTGAYLGISSGIIIVHFVLTQLVISGTELPNFVYAYDWLIHHKVINLPRYMIYFNVGVLFYLLFSNKSFKYQKAIQLLIVFYAILICVESWNSLSALVIKMSMIILFMLFVYYPDNLNFLKRKWILRIGISSYFLYLIHQNIGILIIKMVGLTVPLFDFLVGILVMIFLTFAAIHYTEKFDLKVNALLKQRFFNKKPSVELLK